MLKFNSFNSFFDQIPITGDPGFFGFGIGDRYPGGRVVGRKYSAGLDFMARYLVETENAIEKTSSAGEFYYYMAKKFPTASLNILSNEMNAEVFKGGREWAWNEDPDPAWLKFRTAWLDD